MPLHFVIPSFPLFYYFVISIFYFTYSFSDFTRYTLSGIFSVVM